MSRQCPYHYIIAIDLEATCDENHIRPSQSRVKKGENEIIEIGLAVVCTTTLQILHQQQIYCNPETTEITPFCTHLTGISYETLEKAGAGIYVYIYIIFSL